MRASIKEKFGSLRGSKTAAATRPTAAQAVAPPPTLDDAVAVCSTPIIERVFKVIVIGSVGIGKTSLLRAAAGQDFRTQTKSTIGLDYFRIRQSNNVAIQAWDSAGMESFNIHLAAHYYRGAHAVVLCYDITDRRTFDALFAKHLPHVLEEAPRAMLVLIGTKQDLVREMTGSANTVPTEDALAEVRKRGIPLFRETSAAEHAQTIRDTFADISTLMYNVHFPASPKSIPPFKDDTVPSPKPVAMPSSTPVVILTPPPPPPNEGSPLQPKNASCC